jgi:hypothetical protein
MTMPDDIEDDWALVRPGRAVPQRNPGVSLETGEGTSIIWVGFFYEDRAIDSRIPIRLPRPEIDGYKQPYLNMVIQFTPRESCYIDQFRLFFSDTGGPSFASYSSGDYQHWASNTDGVRASFKIRTECALKTVKISNRVAKAVSEDYNYSYDYEE